MSRYCIIGRGGFLGGALARRLGGVDSFPMPDTKVLFHFGSHTHPVFEQNPNYEMKRVLDDFTYLLPYCHERGILFVYPSSALVYEQDTQFSRFKKTLEALAGCYGTVSLGLRIFPVYGPGETHTVISQWCRQMASGDTPVVYGDGTQARDFIYIEDAVDQILAFVNAPAWAARVVDVGAGNPVQFNSIVAGINAVLGTAIEPRFIPQPQKYPEGAVCRNPPQVRVYLDEGIRRVLHGQGARVPNSLTYRQEINAG